MVWIVTIIRSMGVDVEISKDTRDIVCEDLGEHGWSESFWSVMEMQGP